MPVTATNDGRVDQGRPSPKGNDAYPLFQIPPISEMRHRDDFEPLPSLFVSAQNRGQASNAYAV